MEHSPWRRESGRRLSLRIGPFILRGGGPLYDLPVIDVSLRQTCLVFPRGTRLAVGDVFRILRPFGSGHEPTLDTATPRRVVAIVKIVGLEAGSRAVVRVLRGKVEAGFWAEQVDEVRLGGLLYLL